MEVTVFNICSTALDMLKFSTEMAIENAGTDEIYYLIVLWNPTTEVLDYLGELSEKYVDKIGCTIYKTDKSLSFIENLRNCFNLGFEDGFKVNDYVCGINTDMAFYENWLINLVKYADKDSIINCRQIEPNPTIHHELGNFGNTVVDEFRNDDWKMFCSRIYEDKLISEEEWKERIGNKGARSDATPHLIHKSVWKMVGPWQVKMLADVTWFDRAKLLGIKNMTSLGSIVYHRGAIESRRRNYQIPNGD